MNREIKFKFWLGHTKKMTYEHSLIEISHTAWDFTEDIIALQFTGLKDKNGKEIYEGDIVNAAWMHHGEPGEQFRAYIFYNEHIGSFRIGYDSLGGGSQDEIYFSHQVEVIGNIYENRELIKTALNLNS